MRKTLLVISTLMAGYGACASAAPLSQSIPEESHVQFWKGISLVNHLDIEGVANLSGGQAQGSTATGLWKGALALHTGKAGWWSGGLFLVEGLVANSGNPNAYVGDLQGVSNLTTPFAHIARLYKAYYRQSSGPFTVRVGLINPNDYFNTTGVAAELFNASHGIYPTLTANVPYTPTYPYSSLGAMGSYQIGDTTIQLGAFNADGYTPFRRPWLSDGQIYYGEIDQALQLGPGTVTLKAGGYYNHVTSNYLQNPNDPNAAAIGTAPSQGGFYTAAEYRWKAAGVDCGSFVQGGGAPNSAAVSPVNAYVAVGLRLRNFVPGSPKSTLSLGFDRAWQRQSGAETSIEVNFRQPVFKQFYIQPDLQYILNPGANAVGAQLPNALVGILRIGWRGSLTG
ncbi:carbohydrate porin [Acidithiobacillus sp. AMEEHan]|uniref:carbohydrate porin n=1 Tax=Acidithiobacillus sp. AMEEHan TaxID=2994951 RepID=UPI0027E41FB8|nr:carbohydrate porin [Acidithiobacillus sp. AMEEHan]